MTILTRQKLVVLGMMGRMPVAGAVWQALHYLIGFERLGFETYYVEAHGCVSWAFGEDELAAAAFVDGVMRRFDMGDRWAVHARSGSGAYYGLSQHQVTRLYDSAAAIINLHGGTVPTPELRASKRLVYIDTDPVAVQVEIQKGVQSTLDFLDQHCAFFTFGENYSKADCALPVSDRFPFKATRQPVFLDFWNSEGRPGKIFTTVGNWLQLRRVVEYEGVEYHWSKHLEFLKFLDLPKHTSQQFELALSSCDEAAQNLLKDNGWHVRDAFGFSRDLDVYRQYVRDSRGEFTVAKDQNIRFNTGWFSDRSATYLAAGKPVITQDTGFSNVLPTGTGLFSFSTADEVLSAIDEINSDYDKHQRAATAISKEYFSHQVVLSKLLAELGIESETPRPADSAKVRSASRPAVNVIGYVKGGTGIGTLIQRYIRALEAVGWPIHVVDIHSSDRRSIANCHGGINLICCDIDSYFSFRARLGEELFRNRYNIGLWSWELASFPPKWHDRFAYFDEIWAPTSSISSAISSISPVPVVTVAPVLTPHSAGSRDVGRRRLGLNDSDFVYTFIFNFHSRVQRKNPLAVLEAFTTAFTPDQAAHLIVKCVNADFNRDCFSELLKHAAGQRISIYDGEWSTQEVNDLVEATDCYVSLHRAEGVGLTISDAMAAGKAVIATGWSGNMDFMNVNNSFPVRYELIELEQDVTHYRKGDLWAEPSIAHAAELLRYVFDCRAEAAAIGQAAARDIACGYSPASVGKVLESRLGIIARRHHFRALQEALAQPVPDLQALPEKFSDLGGYTPTHYLRYALLKEQLQGIVRTVVPRNAVLLVVSKGDEDLLSLHEGEAWHFPSGPSGVARAYAGHHPKDSAEAIDHLDSLRAQGGSFLLIPQSSFWWLEYYSEFRHHLEKQSRVIHSDEACHVFELTDHKQAASGSTMATKADVHTEVFEGSMTNAHPPR